MITEERLRNSRILVVDDEPVNVKLLERILEWKEFKSVKGLTDPNLAIEACRTQMPDLVLLDLHMPQVDGYQVLEQIRGMIPEDDFVPILVFTADIFLEARIKALTLGASDFLTKPCDQIEICLRVENFLRLRHLHSDMRLGSQATQAQAQDVFSPILEACKDGSDEIEIRAARLKSITAAICGALGKSLGEQEKLGSAVALYDLCKTISALETSTSGPVKATERLTSLQDVLLPSGRSLELDQTPISAIAARIALTCHANWDGTGQPTGLSGEDIPLEGRIAATTFAIDEALAEDGHISAASLKRASACLGPLAGSQLDPATTECLEALVIGLTNTSEAA